MEIENFLTHLKARDVSPHTITAYRGDLKALFPDGVMTRAVLDQSLADAKDRGASNPTLSRRLSAARSYFRWRRESGDPTPDPTIGMRMRKKSNFVPVYMTKAETTRFFRTILRSGSNDTARDFAIMSLMIRRGLRVSEVVNMDIQDFIYTAKPGEILVHQKGGLKVKKIIGDDVVRALRCYLLRRDADEEDNPDAPVGGALFLGKRWNRISTSQIKSRVRYWSEKAKIGKKLTPHSLRHTFATGLYSHTKNPRLVQIAMGHACLETTVRYTHINEGDLAGALGASHG